jgi:hypothetical protein
VKSFSQDGLTAIVDSERFDFEIDYFELVRKRNYATSRIAKGLFSVRVAYAAESDRWKEDSLVVAITEGFETIRRD